LEFINDQAVDAYDKPKNDIKIIETQIKYNPYRRFVKEFEKRRLALTKDRSDKRLSGSEQASILKNIFTESEDA